ncbi:hypothetical protein C0993_008647 [Termitomyces sp. T159_Od127]|nr:hypothetical protein C0993_008647 [Termitomyces sp. T159_Od127]
MHFKTLVVVACFVAASVAQTFSMVDDKMNKKVAPAITKFNTTIYDFPMLGGGTVKQAMAMHYSAMTVTDTICDATYTMNNVTSKFSDDEGMKIIHDIEAMEPEFIGSMKGIAARLPALQALPGGDVPSLIKNDLKEMKNCADAFIMSFDAHSSPKMLEEGKAIKKLSDAAFSQVMSTYEIE